MRITLAAIGVAMLSATPLLAQDTTAVVCREAPCLVVFEWGNSSSMPPEPDRRYGSPSELESAFLGGVQQAGLQVMRSGQAPVTLLVRIMPLDRALCDAAVGTDPDYTCHTAQRATITIQQAETPKGGLRHVDVNPHCTDPKTSPSFAQFGRFAADYFVFMVNGQRGRRPTSIRC